MVLSPVVVAIARLHEDTWSPPSEEEAAALVACDTVITPQWHQRQHTIIIITVVVVVGAYLNRIPVLSCRGVYQQQRRQQKQQRNDSGDVNSERRRVCRGGVPIPRGACSLANFLHQPLRLL